MTEAEKKAKNIMIEVIDTDMSPNDKAGMILSLMIGGANLAIVEKNPDERVIIISQHRIARGLPRVGKATESGGIK